MQARERSGACWGAAASSRKACVAGFLADPAAPLKTEMKPEPAGLGGREGAEPQQRPKTAGRPLGPGELGLGGEVPYSSINLPGAAIGQ